MSASNPRKTRYQRIENFSEGNFEQDLVIMHRETQDTLMLNSTAAAIWEALQWPQSVDELAELLLEAFPEQPRDQIIQQVEEALGMLSSRGFITPGNKP